MKSYKIVALGASGAGKTVFLSSLYKELSTQSKSNKILEVLILMVKISDSEAWRSHIRIK